MVEGGGRSSGDARAGAEAAAAALGAVPESDAGAVPLPPPSVPPLSGQDYWLETEDLWIRVHVTPRFTRFYPGDAREGPSLEDLQPTRTTTMLFSGGSEAVKTELWEDEHLAKAKSRKKWKGRSGSTKKKTVKDCAALDTLWAPIKPGSTQALRASLSSLRTELARAQRQDPRLADIIARPKRELVGTYLAEPRMPEGRRTQVRALKYRLASDGVLVA